MAEEQETKARRACLGHSDIQESSDLQQDRVSQQSPRKHTVRRDQSQVVQNVSIGDHSAVSFGPATGITVNQAVIKKVTDIEPDLQQDLLSQESSRVHTARPNQNAEVLNLYKITGDCNTVIVGPATRSMNQSVNQNVTGTPDQEQVQAAARKAKEALKKVYTTTGSYVQMLPWVDDDKIHIMKIYTKLRLVEQVDKREIPREENNMKSYEEMFQFKTWEKNLIKRVVISGKAGIGKTTLIDKIAYDWALGDSETLNKYELAFVLKMRSLKQSSDLVGAIFDHLLDKKVVDQSALKDFIYNNQDKVLILLDGFDEFKIATLDKSSFGSILKVLNRKQCIECWVVITTRPPLDKLVNSSLVEKPYTHVRVEGFSNTDREEYVNKFFPEDDDKAIKLIQQIQLSVTLSDLAKSPMLLLLMCLLWEADKTLPDTMTRLYNKALKYIYKRKTKDIKEDAISDNLITVGRVALDHLISENQSFALRKGDFEKSALEAAINAGVLTDGLDTYQQVLFMHHTFLEYCAAMYWQSLIKTAKFKRILDQISIGLTESTVMTSPFGSSRYEYLFRFCCGDNEACTHRILKKVHQDSELALLCYFESQSKELPPKEVICSVLSDQIVFSNHIDEHQNKLFYFLNRLTALSRENDYFTKVKKLHLDFFNFLSDGKDLVEWTKLMTNLQSLHLGFSTITTANIKEILSSLAKPSRLTELSLDCSSLAAQDLSTIAESMGDTLVDLDVSNNESLGGCASIWGPQLGKMECLQNIHLQKCSLKGTDIEPIALGMSGIQTLVHLNLYGNNALGGCAEMWALHLKSMRHLEEVKLSDCSLIDKDIEPIAVALSEASTLVNLYLSCNQGLGGCAKMWALHMKKMNHLKKMVLDWCDLADNDMEPIAESVSDMPTLIHLNLGFNGPLVSSAFWWAPHLKQMIKHLKKLTIVGLTNEDEKHINASIIGNDSTILELISMSDYLEGQGEKSQFVTQWMRPNYSLM